MITKLSDVKLGQQYKADKFITLLADGDHDDVWVAPGSSFTVIDLNDGLNNLIIESHMRPGLRYFVYYLHFIEDFSLIN